MITERDRNDLNKALSEALRIVESTVSWAEARGWTNEQEYLDWEDKINQLSTKDHNIDFYSFKYMD